MLAVLAVRPVCKYITQATETIQATSLRFRNEHVFQHKVEVLRRHGRIGTHTAHAGHGLLHARHHHRAQLALEQLPHTRVFGQQSQRIAAGLGRLVVNIALGGEGKRAQQ